MRLRALLKPGKTRTQCGGNIVPCDVARAWRNVAILLRVARTQEMFLKIFRNIFLCTPQMLRAWEKIGTFQRYMCLLRYFHRNYMMHTRASLMYNEMNIL